MPLKTDFNISPYYDDFDENKKFYKILHRPSTAVQARELTQAQSIIQNQIERFGNHMFKDGSVVEGCNPTELPDLDFVRVSDNFNNTQINVTDITSDYLLVGQTSNVRAVAVASKNGLSVNYPNTNRFYVRYVSTGNNNKTVFDSGETILIYNNNQDKFSNTLNSNNFLYSINVISSNSTVNATGNGFGLRVEDGIVFHRGYFQLVSDQIVIVRDYDQNTGNTVVGFDTIEEIVTEIQDESLLDNALGYTNENAPGAHRLKLTPVAVAKDRTSIANNDAFFTVFEFSNISNKLIINKTKDPYNRIGEFIDSRTYDESGDYVTKPFIVETIEGSNTTSFSYQVSSGKGFVHGSQIEYTAAKQIETDKATTTQTAEQQIISANYGNYVYAKEYAGALNFANLVSINLYDAPLQAITNKLTPSLVGKNQVGTAKVKAVIHDEGDHGQPNTLFRVYLTDIVMNSGKSFYNDVKSFYANSGANGLGDSYGDVANSTTKAIIYEGGKSNLVFPFGKKALKTLRSGNGSINDTQFYFRSSSNATLQTNGFLSVTTSSSYTGGSDILGYSTGILGDSLENDFIVTLTSNVSSANITGTIGITSACNQVTGTNLNSYFANGEFIKIYETTGTISYHRIVSSNSGTLVLGSTPSTTNASSNFAKHYPQGYVIPLNNSVYPGTRQINVTSNTTFEISTGTNSAAALESTANVVVQYRMLRTGATQARKEVRKDVYVKLFANSSSNNSWNLGLPDVYNIKKVYANTAGYSTSSADEVTNYFILDNGQREDFYDHSRLVLKPQHTGAFTNNEKITVILDHFTPNFNNGIGFFSVDSYPTTNSTANSSSIQWIEISNYVSSVGSFDLRDCVDFRSYKANTANSSFTLAGATENPSTSSTFVTNSIKYLVEPDTNFQADIEYYLGRIDLVTMNSTGGLGVVKGTPSENPRTPFNDTDTMILATAQVPPWPTLSVRESEAYNRKDYTIKTKRATNRGYTMRDIGVLDSRIERLEYYTTLNQLEQKAQNIQVPDSLGLNRFKNGIFSDPMTSHIYANTTDFEYKWSIDSGLGYGRPLFSSENVDLSYKANTLTVQQTGKFVTLPYTHELYIYQPFATKIRNNTQDLWSWKGAVELYPNYDMNRDETRLPNVDASIDLTQPFNDFANIISQATGATIFGTRWGDWRTTSSSSTSSSSLALGWGFGGLGFVNNTTTTTVSQQERSGTETFMVPVTNNIDLGKFVTDVSVQPYMRSRTIAFVARNLKPNTRIYAFFDDTPVSQHCAPAALNTSLGATFNDVFTAANASGKLDNICVRTGNFGDNLVSDQYGTFYGVFRIPEGTFRVGDRQFQLLDTDSLVTGNDAALTRAVASFTASNISVTSRNATISTVTPTINQVSLTDNRTVTTVTTRSQRIDPIAQAFTIESPPEQSGIFITKIDLFFKKKDPNLGIKVVLVGMTNGVPDTYTVYGVARLNSSQINVSDNSSLSSTFVFNEPIFLSSNKEYAFYVEPEGGSPEYQMWMSETGFFDVLTGVQVFQNPYTGEAFRSSNSRTWTALSKEDIKFNLYVANFTVGSGTAYFENDSDDYITYNSLQLSNSQISLAVGDHVYVINSASNTTVINSSTANGILQFVDTTSSKIKIDSSAGGFTTGAKIGIFRLPQQGNVAQANTTTLIATANVYSIDNPVLHSIVPRFATMLPSGTRVDTYFKGTSNSAVVESNYNELIIDSEREMVDFERVVYSKSNENSLTTGKTLTIKTDFVNTNKYVSPVIDLSRKSALVIKNIINNDNTDEHTRYGKALAKYISQPVVLADGQESEDIRVYLSAYRPYNTDIEVYIKFLNNEDPSFIDSKVWTKLINNNEELRCSPLNIYDYKEFLYTVPTTIDYNRYNRTLATNTQIGYTAFGNTSNLNILQYSDSSGAIYVTYKTFVIKIVLLSTNGIYVPKVNDVRSIALQV